MRTLEYWTKQDPIQIKINSNLPPLTSDKPDPEKGDDAYRIVSTSTDRTTKLGRRVFELVRSARGLKDGFDYFPSTGAIRLTVERLSEAPEGVETVLSGLKELVDTLNETISLLDDQSGYLEGIREYTQAEDIRKKK